MPNLVIVYVWLTDVIGDIIGSAQNAKLSVKGRAFQYGNFIVMPLSENVSFNSNGYAQIQMTETETAGEEMIFSITYTDTNNTTKQVNFLPAIVPNAGAAALTSFAEVA